MGPRSRGDRQRLRRAFLDALDADGDGRVSREEWAAFVEHMRDERLRFLKQYMLIRRKCYFGLGLGAAAAADPGSPGRARARPFADPAGLVRRGWLRRGWAEDYWYCARSTPPPSCSLWASTAHRNT